VEGFPFVHSEVARYRDADGFGHVNNAVYLTYLEQARNAFLRRLGLVRRIEDIAMILARVEIDYRAELEVDDEIEIGVRCLGVGTKSFELEYRLRSDGRLVAEAKTVLVGFDYERGESTPLAAAWREALAPTSPPSPRPPHASSGSRSA
jgi:acyl-CoA thioester hydrolase